MPNLGHADPAPMLAVLVLAAGGSTRFGQPKLLQRLAGDSLLARAAAIALELAPTTSLVVLGADAAALRRQVPPTLTIVEHAHWGEGIGSSLACGVRALPAHCAGVLVLLADQAALTAAALRPLCERWRADPDAVVCARYDDAPGVPAILPRRCFAELGRLRGDRGAKDLLRREGDALVTIELPAAAVDVDTPAELARLRASIGADGD